MSGIVHLILGRKKRIGGCPLAEPDGRAVRHVVWRRRSEPARERLDTPVIRIAYRGPSTPWEVRFARFPRRSG